MLDELRDIFLAALNETFGAKRKDLIEKWNAACEDVYRTKEALLREERRRAKKRIAELEAQLAAHEQALAVEDVAVAYLEICDRNCAGDWTTEIPQCRFYNPPDIGAFGEPLPCGCELEDYCEHHAEAALKEQEGNDGK